MGTVTLLQIFWRQWVAGTWLGVCNNNNTHSDTNVGGQCALGAGWSHCTIALPLALHYSTAPESTMCASVHATTTHNRAPLSKPISEHENRSSQDEDVQAVNAKSNGQLVSISSSYMGGTTRVTYAFTAINTRG